jgi:hypothetical protein
MAPLFNLPVARTRAEKVPNVVVVSTAKNSAMSE